MRSQKGGGPLTGSGGGGGGGSLITYKIKRRKKGLKFTDSENHNCTVLNIACRLCLSKYHRVDYSSCKTLLLVHSKKRWFQKEACDSIVSPYLV